MVGTCLACGLESHQNYCAGLAVDGGCCISYFVGA